MAFGFRKGNRITLKFHNVQQLLQELGTGKMSNLAYDTAWIARLGEIDRDLSNPALEWLCENQLPDGSWGAKKPFYYHDRVVSTLAAMIALTHRGQRIRDKWQIEKGLLALEKITSGATRGLHADSNGATVGFEMIVPTLIHEAEELGIIKKQGGKILGRMKDIRKKKISMLKGIKINKNVTMAFSAEMAGNDSQHTLDIDNLQELNGSIGNSPSATAYFANAIKPGNKASLEYLHKFIDSSGGAPGLIPFEAFEANWVLWNLSLVDSSWHKSIDREFQNAFDILRKAWKPGKGIGLSREFSVPDGDDTLISYELFSRFGTNFDIRTVLAFEGSNNFFAYPYEAHSSPSLNIHALRTLQKAGFKKDSPNIKKIINYLKKAKSSKGYWLDKWNLSPYYSTAHAIIACAGFADELVTQSVDWMIQSQNDNGSWGYQFATAEETAYGIQALTIWNEYCGRIPSKVIKKAVIWLKDHSEPPYPPLWLGKGLYTPDLIVQSAILSALALAQGGFSGS